MMPTTVPDGIMTDRVIDMRWLKQPAELRISDFRSQNVF